MSRLLLLLLAIPLVLAAQSASSTIFGTVTDSTGSAVVRADLTATSEATGVAEKVSSNSDGYYIFPDLRPAAYRITCTAAGFQTTQRTGLVLEVGRSARVDLTLQVGDLKQVVEVQGSVSTVDTLTSTVKDVVDSNRMDDLPLNGRNALQLQGLLPGAIQMGSGAAATTIALNTNMVFSVNGTRASQSAYMLDGGLDMDMYNNVPAAFPNPDALQEFSMLQNTYSAVTGRDAGAVITMVTKSGTNQLHGEGYDFVRNFRMDSRNFFSPSVSPLHRNQFGGNVGGPIVLPHFNGRDRTFFFVAYEGTRQEQGLTSSSTVVPTALEREGNFSQSTVHGKPITVAPPSTVTAANPNGTPYAGDILPSVDPVATAFTNAFLPPPTPGVAGNIYVYNLSVPTDDNQVVVKVDHSISNANHLSVRYFWDNYYNLTNYSVPAFNGTFRWITYNAAINDVHSFTPTLVNSLNVTVAKNNFFRKPQVTTPANWADLGCTSCVALAPTPTDWILSIANGFGVGIATNYMSHMMNYHVTDTLSWTKGNHLIQFGGDLAKVRRNGRENFDTDVGYSFNGLLTGSYGYGFADFYSGAAVSIYQNSPIASWQYKWTPFLYAQDDWRITHKLTLNLGVRWEPYITVRDAYGEDTAFRPGLQSTIYPHAPLGYLFPGDPGVDGIGIVPNRLIRFSPRVGFAYDPWGNGKTSIRGAYGIFSDTIQLVTLNSNPTSQPFSYGLTTYNVSLDNPYANSLQNLNFLVNYQGATNITPAGRQTKAFYLPMPIMDMNPNFTSAYVQQWNLSVQRELWRKFVVSVGYIGNKGTHLHVSNQINPGIYIPGASTTTNIDSRRPWQGYQTIESIQSTAYSTYNSLQVNWNRRFQGGFTLLGSYVYSRAIDLESNDGNSGLASQATDPFDWNFDKGLAGFNVEHRFVNSFIWNLPIFRGSKGVERALLGGWSVNGILTLQTGIPFSCMAGTDRSFSGIGLDRCNGIGPIQTYNNESHANRIKEYFNTASFTAPPLGTFGTSGRDIMTGPGFQNLDAGLFKDFHFSESRKLEIRWEVFNSTNHPDFGNPNATYSSSNSGKILTAGNPRIMQLAGKFYF
jgi:hypothetical protein